VSTGKSQSGEYPSRELVKARLAEPGEASKKCSGPMHDSPVYLTLDSFHKNRRRYDGLDSRCKDCRRYVERLYPEKHRERARLARRRQRAEKGVLSFSPGYRDRLSRFVEGGDYELPDSSDAVERLRSFESGGGYKE
jgi:hypothetical protein